MQDTHHALEPNRWAALHFGEAPFSDVRRTRRLQAIGEALAASPGASIPQLFAHRYDVKATYAFFAHPEVDVDSVQSTHRAWVMDQLEQAGAYLLIEDTTELDWTGRARIPGLGPIGNRNEGTQGIRLHSVLAARWNERAADHRVGHRPPLEVLGLVVQDYHRRIPRPAGDRRDDSRARKRRPRESQRWLRSGDGMGLAPRAARWVRVGDAEADIYEYLQSCQARGHGHVIRSGQDRALVGADGRARLGFLHETARQQPILGRFVLQLPARPGHRARAAELAVSAVTVRLRAPQRPGASAGRHPPITCTAVRVWEPDSPAATPLEWILLCDAPVTTFAEAHTCVRQ